MTLSKEKMREYQRNRRAGLKKDAQDCAGLKKSCKPDVNHPPVCKPENVNLVNPQSYNPMMVGYVPPLGGS